MPDLSKHNPKPCANCGHRDLHSIVSGCIEVISEPGERIVWCPCKTYVAPARQTGRTIPSRNTDPATSVAAAAAYPIRKGTQRTRLLVAFSKAADLTDEEAMEAAEGVSPVSEYAKRCSELRDAGYIEATGETREGGTGVHRIVSRVTDAGLAALR